MSGDESPDGKSVDGDPLADTDSRSEGDIWQADHPSLKNEFTTQPFPVIEPEDEDTPEAPNITPEGARSDPKGRDVDGRCRNLKNQPRPHYYCTFGEK